jgi:hypothetical protein
MGLAQKIPGYPKTTKAYFLIVDKATPLDPDQPFDLLFTLGRQFGTNQVLNRAEKRESVAAPFLWAACQSG